MHKIPNHQTLFPTLTSIKHSIGVVNVVTGLQLIQKLNMAKGDQTRDHPLRKETRKSLTSPQKLT